LTNVNNGARPDVTGVSRNQKQLVIPVDDERNNESFKSRNPNVIFRGRRKKKVPKHSDLNPIQRSRPHVRINNTPTSGRTSPHSVVGQTPQALGNPVDDAFNNDPEPEGSESGFLFHELANEDYTLEDDMNNNSDSDRNIIRTYEGGLSVDESDSLSIPQNLSIADITVFSQTESTDGIPTYVATLTFDVGSPADDYEIRIVKL